MLRLIQNNVYLSLTVGVVIALFSYIDNRKLKPENKPPNLFYLKIFLLSSLLVYLVLYIRTKTFDIPNISLKSGGNNSATINAGSSTSSMENVNINEPNF